MNGEKSSLSVLETHVELDSNKLSNIDGGIGLGTGVVIIGGLIFLGGVFVGYTDEKKGN